MTNEVLLELSLSVLGLSLFLKFILNAIFPLLF